MENLVVYHVNVLLNEKKLLDYCISETGQLISDILAQNYDIKEVVVNYNLKEKEEIAIRKANLKKLTYYEINFEKAYDLLKDMPKNEYTKVEMYFLKFIKMFFKETPEELIKFLKCTGHFTQTYLLEIEADYNSQKITHYKKRLAQKTV